jgi:hypothetical protein
MRLGIAVRTGAAFLVSRKRANGALGGQVTDAW